MQYILKSKWIPNIHSEQNIQILYQDGIYPCICMIHLTLILALLDPVSILKFDIFFIMDMFALIFVPEASALLTSP